MSFEAIGQRLRAARKAKKISQSTLAAQLGMSRASISGIENGTINEIGVRKIISICNALGLELIAQDKNPRPTLQQLQRENDHA